METTDITIKTMPIGFIICFNENCLLAKKCLRRKVAEQSLGSTDVMKTKTYGGVESFLFPFHQRLRVVGKRFFNLLYSR